MSKWCEHMYNASYVEIKRHDGSSIVIGVMGVASCPECGTPRPREKSLAEKFDEHFKRCRVSESVTCANHLAEIAEAHFKETK